MMVDNGKMESSEHLKIRQAEMAYNLYMIHIQYINEVCVCVCMYVYTYIYIYNDTKNAHVSLKFLYVQ